MSGDELSAPAHAKVNLRLRVFGREESGYHGLETLFLGLELADTVRLGRGGDGIRLHLELHEGVEPGTVPGGEENLCVRAARAYLREASEDGGGGTESPSGVQIRLDKRIPAGSGLGGGSADAAAVLRLMNRLHGDALPEERLVRLAGELGSDVPFGLVPGPAALAWGRGHRLLPVPPPAARPALVVLPGVGIATPEAYGWLDADRRGGEGRGDSVADGAPDEASSRDAAVLPPPSELGRWEVLAGLAANDFEAPVFRRHPPIREARDAAAPEATVALLSGSGDAVVAVYPGEGPRDRAARRVVEECGFPVRRTRTLSSPPGGDGPWPLV